MTPWHPLRETQIGTPEERQLPAGVAELTDPDGDALTLTADATGLWVTCTTDGQEVTVGPFPAGTLREALMVVGAGALAA